MGYDKITVFSNDAERENARVKSFAYIAAHNAAFDARQAGAANADALHAEWIKVRDAYRKGK